MTATFRNTSIIVRTEMLLAAEEGAEPQSIPMELHVLGTCRAAV